MNNKYLIISSILFLIMGLDNAFAWTEYQPVIFVGDMSQIYSKMPVFHGYTQEFLTSTVIKQVCHDSSQDGVTLDYCK
ncbi:exported protein of unknown function [Nitrosotalea devaniterrae]|uniref:Uncharacterized protein n=1 Tax=Nitrosotalea devaniterrae TaxID=1078905 RepID=A0A128A3X4_9ARCH|nr:exported protein of unknown function [Candidatus Nitrosotalea devanaterra]